MDSGATGATQPFHTDEALVSSTGLVTFLALAQGTFYVLTGIWALVSIRTFQMVTGPKTDVWLVKTVGVLVTVIGSVLILARQRKTIGPEIAVLATGSAIGLAGIDIVYVARGRISMIYGADALVELLLAAGWLLGWPRSPRR
ncbi:MAG TPA: hypothetical protein VMP10_04005 [Chloroflexota bacterium]|nr:hypothetical protein [Chloroflexota bacterium]